ncbi:VRR-NUC domain-containing protein, partial [Pseudomonas aeruginosa]|uniref:VRR-NUC domain-containing protein n=1 Tax=Pseudomonas aeruginosa TaxID=287 RepID=UPI003F7FB2DF
FEACLGRLEDGSYRDAIRCRYRDKFGMQSPFVYWELLGEELLEQALDCLPAAHLRAWFERLLEDIPGNRAGQNWIRSGRPAAHLRACVERLLEDIPGNRAGLPTLHPV